MKDYRIPIQCVGPEAFMEERWQQAMTKLDVIVSLLGHPVAASRDDEALVALRKVITELNSGFDDDTLDIQWALRQLRTVESALAGRRSVSQAPAKWTAGADPAVPGSERTILTTDAENIEELWSAFEEAEILIMMSEGLMETQWRDDLAALRKKWER